MGDSRVHNIRFYNVEPKAIHCMSYEPDHRKLALSRADSSIEVWDLSYTPHLERILPGRPQGSVEALAWCHQRLFSTGINARIEEYDLQSLVSKLTVPVTAGPAWCLGVNRQKTLIAAGTEDGYINIFSIVSDGLQYEKILDKQEGRILCMAWDATGDFIITGSLDAVRIWNVHTGHALHKMTTGRAESKKETIVWCVAVTDDFTVISGDSRGKVCFWNGHTGTSTETYQTHEADILCVALSEDQSTIYCSGVDPLVASFCRISVRSSGGINGVVGGMGSHKLQTERFQWCRSANRRIHEHDVRALAVCHGKLFSGGVDSYLAMSNYPPKILVKYPPILQAPCVSVCPQSRCVLLRYTTYLELWQLGESVDVKNTGPGRNKQRRQSGDGGVMVNGKERGVSPGKQKQQKQHFSDSSRGEMGPLQLSKDPVKLVELRSRREEHIVCAAVSNNAKWLAYCTESLIRVYTLNTSNNEPKLEKVSPLPEECGPAHRLEFSADSKYLWMVSQKREIHSFLLNYDELSLSLECTYITNKVLKDTVHLLAISKDGKYIIAGDHSSVIAVWKDGKFYCSLPRYKCEPTALAINPHTNDVVVVYADHKIIEFSLAEKKYTKFSRTLDNQHPKQWLTRSFTVANIVFDSRKPDVIILHDDNTICIVDKKKKLATADAKIPRLDPPPKTNDAEERAHPGTTKPEYAFHVIKRYKHLVHLDWLTGDEMVAVEVNPLKLAKQLPPALAKKRFGM